MVSLRLADCIISGRCVFLYGVQLCPLVFPCHYFHGSSHFIIHFNIFSLTYDQKNIKKLATILSIQHVKGAKEKACGEKVTTREARGTTFKVRRQSHFQG